eukprot:31333-Amphidinium_carterae.3
MQEFESINILQQPLHGCMGTTANRDRRHAACATLNQTPFVRAVLLSGRLAGTCRATSSAGCEGGADGLLVSCLGAEAVWGELSAFTTISMASKHGIQCHLQPMSNADMIQHAAVVT